MEPISKKLERTTLLLKKYTHAVFKQKGIKITVDQWSILEAINSQESLTQKELAYQTMKDPASITRILDLLEKNGTVMRNATENDRRSYNISLTEAGKSLVRKINPIVEEINLVVSNKIKKSELGLLYQQLEIIQNNIS